MRSNNKIKFTLAESITRRRIAFTLAEVLITLGIIGVVAAMTLPTVIQSWQEKSTISKLKKMYSTLQQAYNMNKALNEVKLGDSQTETDVAAKEIANIFIPYLKISKDCGTDKTGCMYSGIYKEITGADKFKFDYGGVSAYRILLNDGSSIWFRKAISGKTGMDGYIIFYDTNGKNLPNTFGKDTFMFEIVDDRILPQGTDGTSNPFSRCYRDGIGCAAWVIQEENFEYLKCSGLQLEGPKKKCN